MAKEVKDIEAGITNSEIKLAASKSEAKSKSEDAVPNCNCACETKARPANWQMLDDKATEVKLGILTKLQEGLEGRANMEYLLQLSSVYNNIR